MRGVVESLCGTFQTYRMDWTWWRDWILTMTRLWKYHHVSFVHELLHVHCTWQFTSIQGVTGSFRVFFNLHCIYLLQLLVLHQRFQMEPNRCSWTLGCSGTTLNSSLQVDSVCYQAQYLAIDSFIISPGCCSQSWLVYRDCDVVIRQKYM